MHQVVVREVLEDFLRVYLCIVSSLEQHKIYSIFKLSVNKIIED
jgi:hypothetical protein